MCTSLDYVMYLMGLPISGLLVIRKSNCDPERFAWEFGIEATKVYNISTITSIVKNVNFNYVIRKKAILLLIVRCFIVFVARGHTVSTTYLKMIQNFNKVDSYAWGATLLAFLYKGISDCVVDYKSNLDGND